VISSLALLLNEFATNSTKYGALSTAGRIGIQCANHGETLVVSWTERGGPAVVAPTGNNGFGDLLVRTTIAGLGGEISRDWQPEGPRDPPLDTARTSDPLKTQSVAALPIPSTDRPRGVPTDQLGASQLTKACATGRGASNPRRGLYTWLRQPRRLRRDPQYPVHVDSSRSVRNGDRSGLRQRLPKAPSPKNGNSENRIEDRD
jgi:hypothetical protein